MGAGLTARVRASDYTSIHRDTDTTEKRKEKKNITKESCNEEVRAGQSLSERKKQDGDRCRAIVFFFLRRIK